MTRDEIFTALRAILIDELDAEEQKVTLEARFDNDLEMDSLELVELVMFVNKRFGVKLTPRDAQAIKTVGDAIDVIMQQAA